MMDAAKYLYRWEWDHVDQGRRISISEAPPGPGYNAEKYINHDDHERLMACKRERIDDLYGEVASSWIEIERLRSSEAAATAAQDRLTKEIKALRQDLERETYRAEVAISREAAEHAKAARLEMLMRNRPRPLPPRSNCAEKEWVETTRFLGWPGVDGGID